MSTTHPAFTPADPGMPEGEWDSFLSQRPIWTPRNGPLLVVAPHPDDEILGAGGLIRFWALAGHRVTVVSVTDGEAADPADRELANTRARELRSALRRLCDVHVAVERLRLPDGDVVNHANRLRTALGDLIEAGGTLIAPYECDGHPDHDVVGRVSRDLAQTHRLELACYPIWTWHDTHPRELPPLNWGRFPLELDARRAKARAIDCFATQLRPSQGEPILPSHVLTHFHRGYEAFVL